MKSPRRSKAEKSTAIASVDFFADWKPNPFLSQIDLHRHVLATGGTGCGKTLSVVLPLLESCIRHRENDRAAAVFICDVKGDLTQPVREMVAQCGRQGDLVEISPESGVTIDVLEILTRDPLTGGALLYRAALADANTGGRLGDDNAYWEMGMIEYLASALAWSLLLGVPLKGSTLRMLLGMRADTTSVTLGRPRRNLRIADMERLKTELYSSEDPAVRQLSEQLSGLLSLAALETKTWSIFQSIVVQITSRLSHPLIDTLCSNRPSVQLDSWLGEGKIFLVRLPFDLQPLQSNFLARLLKMSLFKRVLTQSAEAVRPSFFVIDEAHRFVTGDDESGDHNFIDRCRAFRCGCVYATQSLNPIKALMEGPRFDTFLANVNTRLFGRTLDIPTSEVAGNLLGDIDLIDGYQGVQCVCVPDPDPEQIPQPTFEGRNGSALRLSPADLASLRPGEFYFSAGADRGFLKLSPWRELNQLAPVPLKQPSVLVDAVRKLHANGVVRAFKDGLSLTDSDESVDDVKL